MEFIIVLTLLTNQNYGHEHYSDELDEYCILEQYRDSLSRYSEIVEHIVLKFGVYCPQLWSVLSLIVEYIVPSCGIHCS